MKTLARVLLLLLLAVSSQAGEPFLLGVAPHTSARVIMQIYQPLRRHLEKALGMPVEVVTATDFTEFGARVQAGAFDLVVTTGHQARLFQKESGFLPLLTYQADFRAVVLIPAKAPFSGPRSLTGQQVLGLSPSSLVTLWGEHWLKDNGAGDVRMRYVSASDSLARLLLAGEAKAGFTSLANYQNLPAELKEQLRVCAQSRPLLGRVYILAPRHKARAREVTAHLWSFAASEEGKAYFAQNHLEGYRRIQPRELAEMDHYAAEVRRFFQAGR